MRCSLTKCVEMSWLLYKKNGFHFALGLYFDNAQRTSKRGENISHATSRTSLFSPRFDVLCALSKYRPKAKWNLFVKCFPNVLSPITRNHSHGILVCARPLDHSKISLLFYSKWFCYLEGKVLQHIQFN